MGTVTARQGQPDGAPPGPAGGSQAEAGIPAALMRPPCDIEILIPAKNEARRLPHALFRMIRYLEQQPYSSALAVIDNGSADRTVNLVKRLGTGRVPIHLVGCAERGKGAAVRRGVLTTSARYVGYMDADLATPIETLDFIVPLLNGGYDAVIGSRHIGGATLAEPQPGSRILGGAVFRFLVQRILPGIEDSQCGCKFFTAETARTAIRDLRVTGFAFDVELLRAVLALDVNIVEIPVVWSDQEGSTMNGLRDGVKAAADVFRLARRSTSLCAGSNRSPGNGSSS
jgi:dolichyl-phosphate beta-glucosyltransferase